MGRPLRKANFGNTTGANNQLQVLADIGAGAELCWIMDQPGSRTYTVASVAGGATPSRTGRAILQGTAITGIGQAQLEVSPFGAAGNTANGTTTLGAVTATVGATGAGYVIADTLTVVGGTQTEAAIFDVNDLSTVAGQDETDITVFTGGDGVGGTAAVIGDVYTMDEGSTVRVDNIDGNGDVTEFTVLTASTSGIVGNNQVVSYASLLSGTGDNILFAMTMATATQGVFDVTVTATDGSYTVVPADPAATTTGGAGSGTTLDVDYGVATVVITDGGSGYVGAPAVTFTGGGGTLAAGTAVLTADAVTSVTMTVPGSGYTTPPAVTFAAPAVGGSELAYTILQHRVKTWEGNTYSWKLDVAAAAAGEADLQSA